MAVPKVISATDFTDESNPTVTFTNTSGRKISMFISVVLGPGDEMMYIRTDPAFYSSPYTFDIPEYTRQYIREDFPNKKKLTVHIGVIDSGTEEGYYVTKTMTFVNGEPEFTNINGYDVDSLVVNVTGDNSILLMGKSNFAIDWTPAVGKKYATIKSYTVEWQDQSKTYTASASHPVSDFVLASSGTSLLRITATDSRGFTTTVEKELDVIEYVAPVAVITIGRINNYEDETKLKIDASYTSVMAGDVEKNSITCKYRYKQNSETAVWSEWTTVANNEEITLIFPKENEYLIQYTATDAFGEIWAGEYKLNKGKFPMFIDTELNAVGINDFPKTGEALRVAGGSFVAEDAQFTGNVSLDIDKLGIKDYIIEYGDATLSAINVTARWEKWASGKAVMEFKFSGMATADTVWTAPIYYKDYTSFSNVFTDIKSGLFIEAPNVKATSNSSVYIGVIPSNITVNGIGSLRYLSVNKRSSTSGGASFRAVGKWK